MPFAEFDGITLGEDGTVTGLEIHVEGVEFDLDAVVRPISTLRTLDASGCSKATGTCVGQGPTRMLSPVASLFDADPFHAHLFLVRDPVNAVWQTDDRGEPREVLWPHR